MQIPSEVLWTRTLGINLAHGKIWYSPMAFNGIFCANIYTGKTMPISDLNVLNEIYKGPKFSYVIRSGHYFYFCPVLHMSSVRGRIFVHIRQIVYVKLTL